MLFRSHALPWDGKSFGRLKASGPAVSKAYYRVDKKIVDDDGFFDTGDVATIDEHGYMRITDRSKDVIKSGGEWISSIELENLAVSFRVREAISDLLASRQHASVSFG